jgi:hypothetical protein
MSDVTHEIRYRAQGPTLAAYIACTERRSIIIGPLGSGKTNASCYKLFRVALEETPYPVVDAEGRMTRKRLSRLLAVRNTYSDLTTTTIPDWLEMFGDLGDYVGPSSEPPHHELSFQLEDGTVVESLVHFIALDRPDDVRKLRGLPATAIWVNEVKEIARAVFDMVDLRVGRYKPEQHDPRWHGLIGDTNAPDTDHWLYALCEEDRPEGFAFFRQPGAVTRGPIVDGRVRWQLNPNTENLVNLVPDYYRAGMQGKRDDWIAVNFANEYGFVSDGKPVYEEYRDATHCREFELDRRFPLAIGFDFGHTPAMSVSQRGIGGRMRTRYELTTEHMGLTRFFRLCREFLLQHCVAWHDSEDDTFNATMTGDPSGNTEGDDELEQTAFQIAKAQGLIVKPARTQDFSVRRDSVANAMTRLDDGEPGYLVHPDCKMLRKAHQGAYCLRRLQVRGMDRYRDVPDKTPWSHVAEAEQYGFIGAGEGRAVLRPNPRDIDRDGVARLPRPRVAVTEYDIFG